MIRSRRFLFLFLIPLSILHGCAVPAPKICTKEGKEYCVNPDWIYVTDWDSCYRRGLSCMEGECWEYAIEEFKQAITFRYTEKRDARPYGMHFRDYFPHREMGICYLNLGNRQNDLEKIQKAMNELELSMDQTQSARAKHYLNQTRRSHLLMTGLDTRPPSISLKSTEKEYLTNKTPFPVEGIVHDDRYVASVIINQDPVFIELADPNLPFTAHVDLKEGENIIRIVAVDLVDNRAEKSIHVHLDRQGPSVIVNPIQSEKIAGLDHILITAVIYDESGVVSFKLDEKEVPRLGVEQVFFIEQAIPLDGDKQDVSFWANDRAGNSTQGSIPLRPNTGRRRHHLAMRLACNDPKAVQLAMTAKEETISINITNPPDEEYTTFELGIPIEGRVGAKNGIQLVKLNDKNLFFGSDKAKNLIETNRQKIDQNILQKNIDLREYYRKVDHALQSSNITWFLINDHMSLPEGLSYLNFFVEDTKGNFETRYYTIRKIHKEEVLKSYERMLLAILPIDAIDTDKFNYQYQRYLYNTLLKSFKDTGRFNLVEENKLDHLFSGDLVQTACKTSTMCDENIAQLIGTDTSAEGIICGAIQTWKDGVEIDIRFRETDKGNSCLFHDIQFTEDTTEALRKAISNLTKKFQDSFPECDGNIIDKEGEIIRVDMGLDKRILPCMRYNIFENETDLITKASVKNVRNRTSEAEISEAEKSRMVRKGFGVRTR